MNKTAFHTIDEYIATFPEDVQQKLAALRRTIRAAAPQAQEVINYQIPTYQLYGNLVHFAAYKKHIGFYGSSEAAEEFRDELSRFMTGKGTLQFPLNEPLPLKLIAKIVRFRAKENRALRPTAGTVPTRGRARIVKD